MEFAETAVPNTPHRVPKWDPRCKCSPRGVALDIETFYPYVLVLISNQTANRETPSRQERAFTILNDRRIPFETLDGADPVNHDLRNELFTKSGLRGCYPQFFLVTAENGIEFWGDWDRFEYANDQGMLVADLVGKSGSAFEEEDFDIELPFDPHPLIRRAPWQDSARDVPDVYDDTSSVEDFYDCQQYYDDFSDQDSTNSEECEDNLEQEDRVTIIEDVESENDRSFFKLSRDQAVDGSDDESLVSMDIEIDPFLERLLMPDVLEVKKPFDEIVDDQTDDETLSINQVSTEVTIESIMEEFERELQSSITFSQKRQASKKEPHSLYPTSESSIASDSKNDHPESDASLVSGRYEDEGIAQAEKMGQEKTKSKDRKSGRGKWSMLSFRRKKNKLVKNK